jgi:hypothetical protein
MAEVLERAQGQVQTLVPQMNKCMWQGGVVGVYVCVYIYIHYLEAPQLVRLD